MVYYHSGDLIAHILGSFRRHQFEINALGTTWSLLLNKPYDDGGGENSKRVDPDGKFLAMARLIPVDLLLMTRLD